MKEKQILIYCDTPFQIMIAVHLQQTDLQGCKVDIIIADHIYEYEKLLKNITNLGIFRNVYFMKAYDLDYRKSTFSVSKIGYLKNIISRKTLLNELLDLTGTYDEFFATDILESTNLIYDALIKKNPNLIMVFYEEGPVSVMCNQNHQFNPKRYGNLGNIKKTIFKLIRYRTIEGNYGYGYSSVSNIAHQGYYFPMLSIPKFDGGNKQNTDLLNKIWEYNPNGCYTAKYVFFEESFAINGIECPDIQIVQDLIEILGRDSIIVKLHPRTRVNRFNKLGVKTNQDSSIPWELIALNESEMKPVLLALSTGSLIHPQLYWGIKQKAVCLAECKEYKFDYLNNTYYQAFIKVCKEKQLVFLPKSKAELSSFLEKQALNEGENGIITNKKITN